MIPKKLFFIWFGKRPAYVDYSVNAFRQLNPDFSIYTLFRENIDTTDNADINEARLNVLHKYQKYPNTYNTHTPRKFVSVLSDELKYVLINKYGGILCDCDTYPLKPFDDQLLNRKTFFTNVCIDDSPMTGIEDFFFGAEKNSASYFITTPLTHTIYQYSPNKNSKFDKLQQKFLNCNLNTTEHFNNVNCYIDHYNIKSWLLTDSNLQFLPTSKYDTMLF